MKVRNGFVSNSSSSSFILRKSKLNEDQILLIKNHFRCKTIPWADTDPWSVDDSDGDFIKLDTMLDNFDMGTYLEEVVKVPSDAYVDEYVFYTSHNKTVQELEAERILEEVKKELK